MEQLTLSIIKPDAMRRQLATAINNKIKAAGLRIVAQKTFQLTTEQAQRFYAVHKNRPFFNELVAIMTERSVLVQVLAGKNAIERYRQLLGATDPAKAEAGTIRKDHGVSVGENSAHGSDSEENAANEVAFFFSGIELMA